MTIPNDDTFEGRVPDDLPNDPTLSYFGVTRQADESSETHQADEMTLSFWKVDMTASGTDTAPPEETERGKVQEAPSYRLLRVIGAGGMGEVWQALQVSLGRTVAVKRVRPEHLGRQGADETRRKLREFRQESIIAARLEHPNIVPVHDLGEDENGQPLLAMKLVHGKPWDELLSDDFKTLSVPEFLGRHLQTLISVSQAVAFAHSRGVIHRDLKPSQVMVGEFGEVLLMDWGLALVIDEVRSEVPTEEPQFHLPTRQSATNPSGTPAFMAPEQTRPTAEGIGTRTDVYLLGGILYYLLTQAAPHQGKTAQQAFVSACKGHVINPLDRETERDIPAELAGIAMQALQKDPAERVPSATAFIGLLQDYITGATKRRESIALVDQVRGTLDADGLGYGDLSECDNKLVQAFGLWPENHDVGPMRDVVLEKYAREAIGNNDLVLARVQAERIPDADKRRILAAEIEVLAARESRNKRQRRQLIAATFILVLVAGLSLVLVRESYMKNERTRGELQLAQARADLANQKKEEEARRAELLVQINELRRKEVDLAQRIDLQIPPPRSAKKLKAADGTDLTQEVTLEILSDAADKAQRGELIKERDTLVVEREELSRLVGDALEPPPFALLIADANLAMLNSEDRKNAIAAYKLYEEAARKQPGLPDPVIGMGMAALAADHPTSATQLLDKAASIAARAWGEESPRYAELLVLQGQVHSQLDFNDPQAVKYFTESLDIMLPQWSIMTADLAGRLRDKGDFRSASAIIRATYETVVAQYGEEDPRSIIASANLAQILNESGQFEEAAVFYGKLADMYEKERGLNSPQAIRARSYQGYNLSRAGDYPRASEILGKAAEDVSTLSAGESTPTELDDLRAQVYANYASLNEEMNRDVEAEKYYRMALECASRARPGSPRLAAYYGAIGNILNNRDKYEAALLEYQKALEVVTIPGVPDSPPALTALHGLAMTYMHLNRHQEAEAINRRIMNRRIENLGEENPNTLSSMVNLAVSLSNLGKFEEALELVERAEKVYRKRYGDTKADIASVLMNKRLILDRLGRPEEGIAAIREAISINRAVFGNDNEALVGCHEALGHALGDSGDGDGAVAAYNEAIRISTLVEGPSGETTIHLWVELTNAFFTKGDYEAAAENAKKAYDLSREHLPEDNRHRIQSIHNLALALDYLDRPAESEPYHREVVAIREKVLGPDDEITTTSVFNLGCNLLLQERYDEAEPFLKRALDTFEKSYPPTHPNIITALGMYSELKVNQGDLKTAFGVALDRFKRLEAGNRLRSASAARASGWIGTVLADNQHYEQAWSADLLAVTIYAEGNGDFNHGNVRGIIYNMMKLCLDWFKEPPDASIATWLLSAAKSVDESNRQRDVVDDFFILNKDNQGLLVWHLGVARCLQIVAPENKLAIRNQLLRARALVKAVDAPQDNRLVKEFLNPMLAQEGGSEPLPEIPAAPAGMDAEEYSPSVVFTWLDTIAPPVDWSSLELKPVDQLTLDEAAFQLHLDRLKQFLEEFSAG